MIHFLTALKQEAKPLIEHYKMKQKKAPFPYFESGDASLVISGMGKAQAAAATAFSLTHGSPGAIFNVGVCGAHSDAIGDGFLVHKVIDEGSKAVHYPVMLLDGPSRELHTLDLPSSEYKESVLFDMEGFGYFWTAERFLSRELIQSYKIVCDNALEPWGPDTEKRIFASIEGLMRDALDVTVAYAEALRELGLEVQNIHKLPSDYDSLCRKFHFTECERLRLKRLLFRFEALSDSEALWHDALDDAKDGASALKAIEERISTLVLKL